MVKYSISVVTKVIANIWGGKSSRIVHVRQCQIFFLITISSRLDTQENVLELISGIKPTVKLEEINFVSKPLSQFSSQRMDM